jgi:hypothetical protein
MKNNPSYEFQQTSFQNLINIADEKINALLTTYSQTEKSSQSDNTNQNLITELEEFKNLFAETFNKLNQATSSTTNTASQIPELAQLNSTGNATPISSTLFSRAFQALRNMMKMGHELIVRCYVYLQEIVAKLMQSIQPNRNRLTLISTLEGNPTTIGRIA